MSLSARPRIKICGLTRAEDARLVAELGAWAIGMIFYKKSPRAVNVEQARLVAEAVPGHKKVGVFVNASQDEIANTVHGVGLSTVQLHGDESPEFCRELLSKLGSGVTLIKALQPRSQGDLDVIPRYAGFCEVILLDAYSSSERGGTGMTSDWALAQKAAREASVLLAGGLTPENVRDALSVPGIFGVDASSGLEDSPGIKSAAKLKDFFRNANGSKQNE